MNSWKKAALLLTLLAALAAFLLWDNCAIKGEEVPVTLTALPPQFDGLRVAEIADLHGRQFGRGNSALLRAVAAQSPDLICIDGDLFDDFAEVSALEPLLTGLTALAPTFYVTGNHEWQLRGELSAALALLRSWGVTVLQNEYTVLERGGARLVIAGVDDPCGPYDQKTPAELVDEIRAAEGTDTCILMLAHRNDTLSMWAELGVDLVLTGHCHGGVVRLPLVGGVFGTRRELFPDFDAGLYRRAQTALYVSRGMGYSRVHFRLFNRPHLPILVLRSEKS